MAPERKIIGAVFIFFAILAGILVPRAAYASAMPIGWVCFVCAVFVGIPAFFGIGFYFGKGELRGRRAVNLSAIPSWQKALVAGCLVTWAFLGWHLTATETSIYYNSSAQPNASTHRTIPIHVMHGSLRYISSEELENYRTAKDRAAWTGVPVIVLIAVFLINWRKA